jgi:hypothetical protein
MATTILDLFKNKELSGGKTAKETYRVRNSKDMGIQTNSVILNNSSVYIVNALRRTNIPLIDQRKTETLFEQELTGLRPLYQLSSPFIYGTAFLRITQQRSPQTEQMKRAVVGGESNDGIVGSFLNRAVDKTKTTLENLPGKLAVKFPTQLNPTSYSDRLKIHDKSQIPTILTDIKGSAEGNLLGKLLSQPQTPNQLVRNAAGAAIGALKNKARGVLFGERSTTGFNVPENNGAVLQTINYGSDKFTSTRPDPTGVIDAGGSTYSSGFIKPTSLDIQSSKLLDSSLENLKIRSVNQGIRKLKEDGDSFSVKYINEKDEVEAEISLPTGKATFDTMGETADEFTGLVNKVPAIILPHVEKRKKFGYSLYSQMKNETSLEATRGFSNGTTVDGQPIPNSTRDDINRTTVFSSDVDNIVGDNKSVDSLNFIPLKFTLIDGGKTIHFRSIIDGVSETFSPSWDPSKFIGSPFNHYTYSGVERSLSFNLKVMATTSTEMKTNWERLSFLASMTYPSSYNDNSSINPPFIKFTLGNMYIGKEGFIENLSFSVDDTAGWEVGLNSGMEKYKLPKKIDVTIGIKFLETRKNSNSYKTLYAFNPVS